MKRTHSIAALCVLFCSTWAEASSPPPNVLLIMADDVGTETIGRYGGESYATPRLDALAAGGMRFQYCYSMPSCHPTRITLLTGKYPFRLEHPQWGTFPPAEEENTLPHLMKRAGYVTAIAGKWQLTLLGDDPEHPHRLGFGQYCLFGWHEGPRYYQPLVWQNGNLRTDVRERYGPDVYTEFLIDFMAANRDRPFFAFYSMALCHDVTDDLEQPVPYGPDKDRYDSYTEMIEAMDARVGRLVDALERLGLRQRTVILFIGDNGTPKSFLHSARNGEFVREPVYSKVDGRRVRGGKGELTDEGTHVPLIADWPGTLAPGQVSDALVDFSDFLPTLVDLGHGTVPDDLATDGFSFAGVLREDSTGKRTWAYSERGQRCWGRTARWKLYNDGRFFDLAADPKEQMPLPKNGTSSATASAREMLQRALGSLGR